ncbi:unnamed protein product [Brassica oleracea var. botrytis]|uniref:Uncharacterized protein n=2 Tax=Brassica TaxID=3705 RepID=A0A3P6CNP2_BRAOL|nr:unnamed protein product [Brassica napus]CDY36840.1 BnaC04g32330D [Brassica napus]VDD11731.1 unnamed protein product [Brassica oleracea]
MFSEILPNSKPFVSLVSESFLTSFPGNTQYRVSSFMDDSPPSTPPAVSSPALNPIIHTPTVHESPDHNSRTVHTSPDHSSESVQVSPVYITTIHHPPEDTPMITTN